MKIRLALLVLCFVGNTALFAQCDTPKPFKLLPTEKAHHYVIQSILDETTAMALPTEHVIASENKDLADKKVGPAKVSSSKVTLINFWASWCPPCRAELPLLDELSVINTADIQLINLGDDAKMVDEVLSTLKITHLNSRLAEGDLLSSLSLQGLPSTLVWKGDQAVFLGVGKLRDLDSINNWLNCLKTTSNFNEQER